MSSHAGSLLSPTYFLLFPNEKQRRSKIFNSFLCSLEKILRLQLIIFLKLATLKERKKNTLTGFHVEVIWYSKQFPKEKKFYIKFSYSFQKLFSHTPPLPNHGSHPIVKQRIKYINRLGYHIIELTYIYFMILVISHVEILKLYSHLLFLFTIEIYIYI